MLDRLRSHTRYAIRLLVRDRLFTLTAVASLAIGIGANTTIFTAANALLLAPTPGISHPEQLVDIGSSRHGSDMDTMGYPEFVDFSTRTTRLSGLYATDIEPHPLSLGLADGATRIYGQLVSAGFFDVLGVAPQTGTVFHAPEEHLGVPLRKVVLSDGFWHRQFNADPRVAGQSITLNGDAFTIAGVAPRQFHGTTILSPDLWVPLTSYAHAMPTDSLMTGRRNTWLVLGGRLKDDATIAQAKAELNAIHHALQQDFSEAYGGWTIGMAPQSRVPGEAGTAVIPIVGILMTIVGLVLLITCVNLAGLLLARAASRQREIAVRLALGASRSDIIGQLVAESLVLFLCGGGLSLLLAQGLSRVLWSLLPMLPFPVEIPLTIDGRVFAFNMSLALVAGLLTALLPALQSSRPDLLSALKADSSAPRRQRLRQFCVAGQISLCLLLIVVAGLFLRALNAALTVDPGFTVARTDIVSVDLSLGGYTEAQAYSATDQLQQRLAAIPGIERASVAAVVPLEGSGLGLGALRKPGAASSAEWIDADWNVISPEFLPSINLPLVAGRNFTSADRDGATRVAIVNERFARAAWPGQDAIGRTLENGDFRPDGSAKDLRTLTVIGVARDAKYRWLGDGPRNFIYVAMAQEPWRRLNFFLRRSEKMAASATLAPDIRAAVRAFDPNLPIVRILPLQEFANLGLLPQRLSGSIAGALGILTLLLAAIGVYGVAAYAVASRTREIGIRVALGADRRTVAALVLRMGARVALAGGAVGLLLAAAAAFGLSNLGLLFGVPAIDPVAFGGTIVALAGITLAACYVPARRAMAVDPMVALRRE
jgi:predicted permease